MIQTVAVGTDGSETAEQGGRVRVRPGREVRRQGRDRQLVPPGERGQGPPRPARGPRGHPVVDQPHPGGGLDPDKRRRARPRARASRPSPRRARASPADVLCDIAEAYGADVHRGRQQGHAPPGAGQRPEQRLPQGALLGGDRQDDVTPDQELLRRRRTTCSASSRPTRRSTAATSTGRSRCCTTTPNGSSTPTCPRPAPTRASRRSGRFLEHSWNRGTTSTRRSRKDRARADCVLLFIHLEAQRQGQRHRGRVALRAPVAAARGQGRARRRLLRPRAGASGAARGARRVSRPARRPARVAVKREVERASAPRRRSRSRRPRPRAAPARPASRRRRPRRRSARAGCRPPRSAAAAAKPIRNAPTARAVSGVSAHGHRSSGGRGPTYSDDADRRPSRRPGAAARRAAARVSGVPAAPGSRRRRGPAPTPARPARAAPSSTTISQNQPKSESRSNLSRWISVATSSSTAIVATGTSAGRASSHVAARAAHPIRTNAAQYAAPRKAAVSGGWIVQEKKRSVSSASGNSRKPATRASPANSRQQQRAARASAGAEGAGLRRPAHAGKLTPGGAEGPQASRCRCEWR